MRKRWIFVLLAALVLFLGVLAFWPRSASVHRASDVLSPSRPPPAVDRVVEAEKKGNVASDPAPAAREISAIEAPESSANRATSEGIRAQGKARSDSRGGSKKEVADGNVAALDLSELNEPSARSEQFGAGRKDVQATSSRRKKRARRRSDSERQAAKPATPKRSEIPPMKPYVAPKPKITRMNGPPTVDESLFDAFDGFDNRVVETETKVSAKMIETSDDPMSTFSIDVDTGGYTLARARLREGYRPKPNDVRIEEFLNYFYYDYPEPKDGEFSIHIEAAPDPLAVPSRKHLVRIGVKGKSVPSESRPPAHLTFLVDVSGSMFGPDRLGLVIEALDLVSRNLRPDDTIALVTYAKGAHVRLWPAGAAERDIVASTIAKLEPGGSSAMDEGLRLAYEVASTHFYAGHINRVVLLGDGRANVGETRPDALLAAVRMGVEDGVMLSTIGFGAKSFNDQMMERLADRGNGSYFFVDSYREAQRVFSDRLCGTLFAIAKDVKIQVEFNPESVLRHRLLGYENRRLEHQQFRDDSVDAGEIGAGHSVTAIYEVELAPSLGRTLGSVRVRYKKPNESTSSESSYELFSEELLSDVRQASADFKFAAAVAMFAEIARGDESGGEARISLVREIAAEGVTDPETQPDRQEFLALLDEAAPYYTR